MKHVQQSITNPPIILYQSFFTRLRSPSFAWSVERDHKYTSRKQPHVILGTRRASRTQGFERPFSRGLFMVTLKVTLHVTYQEKEALCVLYYPQKSAKLDKLPRELKFAISSFIGSKMKKTHTKKSKLHLPIFKLLVQIFKNRRRLSFKELRHSV